METKQLETIGTVPFHKPYITDDEITEVLDSLRSGWITMGPKTIEFEKRFREYIGSVHAVSMSSCTACLHLALRTAGVGEGDEVIVPAVTFTATAEVITYLKAIPVVVDVDPDTCTIDVAAAAAKVTGKTRAIIPVHYAGQPCDMDTVSALAGEKGLTVIEDAAHALPAWYKGEKIGTTGDMTCFSFYATKTLATGEGGMITTDNQEWSEALRTARLHGISRDAWKRYTREGSWFYEVVDAGYKYNMTDIQAALGLAQLRKLEWMWQRRMEIASAYSEAFRCYPEVTTPLVKDDRQSAWHLYVLRLNLDALKVGRDQFIEELRKEGVTASVHFIPLYRHPYYRKCFRRGLHEFPSSEYIYARIISLPLFPGMTEGEIGRVIDGVTSSISRLRR